MFRRLASTLVLSGTLLGLSPALANDSIAELKTGGLSLVRSDVIVMEREDLFISKDEVRVSYRFRNPSDRDIDTIVAFPMPDIQVNPYGDTALPDTTQDNFLGFSAAVEGRPIKVNLEQKAYAGGLDVSDELKTHGVPLFPFTDEASAAVGAQSPATLRDWMARGLAVNDRYDIGEGMQDHMLPAWTLKSTYWWRMVFPAGKTTTVEHRYKPSLGGSASVNFYYDGRFQGDAYQDYRQRYCMDPGFERAIARAAEARGDGYAPYYETRISYVLKTGANWAGTIGTFHLTVDKGSTKNLVSFCAKNVRKTGLTTFESTQKDFYPKRDLDVLILQPANY